MAFGANHEGEPKQHYALYKNLICNYTHAIYEVLNDNNFSFQILIEIVLGSLILVELVPELTDVFVALGSATVVFGIIDQVSLQHI